MHAPASMQMNVFIMPGLRCAANIRSFGSACSTVPASAGADSGAPAACAALQLVVYQRAARRGMVHAHGNDKAADSMNWSIAPATTARTVIRKSRVARPGIVLHTSDRRQFELNADRFRRHDGGAGR
jgi:hypothetical protein